MTEKQIPSRRTRTLAGLAVVALSLTLAAVLAGIGFANSSTISIAQYQYGKKTICHHTGSKKKPGVTITISENAWKAHQRHGDTEGPCPKADPKKKHGDDDKAKGKDKEKDKAKGEDKKKDDDDEDDDSSKGSDSSKSSDTSKSSDKSADTSSDKSKSNGKSDAPGQSKEKAKDSSPGKSGDAPGKTKGNGNGK
jgi:hypothetical protein